MANRSIVTDLLVKILLFYDLIGSFFNFWIFVKILMENLANNKMITRGQEKDGSSPIINPPVETDSKGVQIILTCIVTFFEPT